MVKPFFETENIACYAALKAADLPVWNREKWARMEERVGKCESAVIFLIPYFAGQKTTNLSVYAQVRDYHLYMKMLTERLGAYLSQRGEDTPFCGFADSSPLSERTAALRAGLGVLGKNGLLLNPRYGSYCFIGAFFFPKRLMKEASPVEIALCSHCAACSTACPTGAISDPERKKCLSLISQKKDRTPEEDALLAKASCKWGCDLCQSVCPFNQNARQTPIPFFREGHIEALTEEIISLPKEEFLTRAFSWRGRGILKKNLGIEE